MGPCLAPGAHPPIQPKLPPSCWLRLLELQPLLLPKQPFTSLYAPQKYCMLTGCPGDSAQVCSGVGECSWAASPSLQGCSNRGLQLSL